MESGDRDRILDGLGRGFAMGAVGGSIIHFIRSSSAGEGASTGGFLQLRQGLRATAISAVFGGVVLALIEASKLPAPPPSAIDDDPKQTPPDTAGLISSGIWRAGDPAWMTWSLAWWW